jgi:hypothetical protein
MRSDNFKNETDELLVLRPFHVLAKLIRPAGRNGESANLQAGSHTEMVSLSNAVPSSSFTFKYNDIN